MASHPKVSIVQPTSILKAFIEKFGAKTLVSDVEPEAVIDYLKSKIDGSTDKRCTYITAMLFKTTAQTYPVGDIRDWASKNLKKDSKEEHDFYWLEEKTVQKMIKAIRKTDCGDYWADAMQIQWWLACRPEEIPMMQAQNVTLNKKDPTRLYIGPINGVRGVKTEDSKANMPIDCEETKKAIKRRLSNAMALLFPRVEDQCGYRDERMWFKNRRKREELASKDPAKKVQFDWEDTHKLWNAKMWDQKYHAKLEEACRLVMAEDKKIKIDVSRVDARTLRRSRGRVICQITQSAEKAATWLRDDVATVEEHYAKVLPSDIKSI